MESAVLREELEKKERAGKGARLQERDIEMLQDIAKCRMLTAEQIRQLYFPETNWWHYRRLRQLAAEGYLLKEINLPGNRQRAACYFITEQGARKAGVTLARARLNYIPPHLRAFWRNLMEVYVGLKQYGWDWIDSRDAKREYGINRGDTVDGLLKAPGGEEYGVYLLGPSPRPDTVEDLQGEIRRAIVTPLRSFMVFAPNPDTFKLFGLDHLGTYHLLLLDYPGGIEVLRHVTSPESLLRLVQMDGYPHTQIYETFANIKVQMGEREHYVTELLTNDLARLYQLQGYTMERAIVNERRGVIIAVRQRDLEWYQEMFHAYPHFRLVPIPI